MDEKVIEDLSERDAADFETKVRGNLDNQYSELRDSSRAIFRAVKGQQGVHTEEQWEQTCKDARRDYKSGRFLIEQLGAERVLEPKLIATLSQLREALIAKHDPDDAAGTMLADLAIVSYYNALRIQGYIGNLCLVLERELFGQDPLKAVYGDHTGATVEDRLKRLGDQLLPLQDRANRMMVRNLKALDDLTRVPSPTVAVGRADQVNVGQQQMNQVRIPEP